MPVLRPYQDAAITAIRASIGRGNRRVLVSCPTGGGKTVLFAAILALASDKGNRAVVLVHREELLDQAVDKLRAVGVSAGIIKAGRQPDPTRRVQVASIATLIRRPMPDVEIVIVDEAHRTMAASYQRILASVPGAVVLGWTATPIRADGRGLGAIYQDLIEVATPAELIAACYLVRPRVLAPSSPDLVGVHRVGGDYRPDELGRAMQTPKLLGDICAHWSRHARGRRAVLFASTVAHSLALVEALQAAGCRAAHVDGDTPGDTRRAVLSALRAGDLDLVSNVGIITEGFDLPELEVMICARPTLSMGLWLQMCGRIMRPPGPALILDHAGNAHRWGLPDDDREWSLVDAPKARRGPAAESPVKTCSGCYLVVLAACPVCPECGQTFAPRKRKPVQVGDGDLVELAARGARDAQRRDVQDLAALMAIAAARGYKPGWAAVKWQRRYHRWPSKAAYLGAAHVPADVVAAAVARYEIETVSR